VTVGLTNGVTIQTRSIPDDAAIVDTAWWGCGVSR